MIKFTVEDVRTAYRATGLKPTSCTWIEGLTYDPHKVGPVGYGQACPLGALLTKRCGATRLLEIDRKSGAPENFAQLAQETLGMTAAEVDGVTNGVDGEKYHQNWDRKAYDLGCKLARALGLVDDQKDEED